MTLKDKIKKGETELQESYKQFQLELDRLTGAEILIRNEKYEIIRLMNLCKNRAIEQGYDKSIFKPIRF